MSPPSGRAAQVHRLFRRPGFDLTVRRRAWWENFAAGDTSFMVGMLASLLLVAIEIPLWTGKPLPLPAWLRFSPLKGAAATAVLLGTGEFVDRLLRTHTGRTKPPLAWRILLRLFARLPLVSFYVPSLWRYVAEARPREPETAILDLHRPSESSATKREWFDRLAFALLPFVWVCAVIVVPLLGALWLGAAVDSRIWNGVAWGVAALLHLGAAGAVRHNLRQEGQRGQVTGFRAAASEVLPWFFLVPLPGLALALAASAYPALRSSYTALVTSVYWRRYNASRLPVWRDLEAKLGDTWKAASGWKRWFRPSGLERSVQAGQAEKELRALERWRALLLCGEGMALGWGLVALGRHLPGWAPRAESAWRLLVWASAGLGVLGLAGQGLLYSARLLRLTHWIDRLEDRPVCRLLLTSQAGFLTGFYAGRLLGEGKGKEATLWLAVTGALAATLGVTHMMLNHMLPSGRWIREESSEAIVLPLTILGLIGLETAILRLGGLGWLLDVFQILAILSLLAAPILGVALGARLLRPYDWSDLRSSRLDRRTRRRLALLVLTLVLPLGGLAMPFWAFARSRAHSETRL